MRRWIVSFSMLGLLAASGGGLASSLEESDCSGTGGAALLIKAASCEPGSPVKFKLAGPPLGRYRLWCDFGPGPVTIPGVGTFCLDFGPERMVLSYGTLNDLGFRSVWWAVPDDPDLVGREMSLQFAAEDPRTGDAHISNAYFVPICEEGGEDCDGGIRRLGYFMTVRYTGEYPVSITSRAFWSENPQVVVGEVTFEYDPLAPPEFPIVGDGIGGDSLTVTSVTAFEGVVVLHAVAKGCATANGRLPNNTTFETVVGGVAAFRDIHTSCSIPISAGSNFNPVFVTSIQDVMSAPEGDCGD
jgi:hypothetical protein